jgi:phosphatidylserine/phosphatidylglycerophosphate/cardiolipin synthase-like enzyme
MNFTKMLENPRIRRNLMLGALALLGFAIAILIYFLFLQPPARVAVPTDKLQTIQPLAQHPQIQIYMNHSEANFYTDPYRNKTRLGDNIEQVIIDAIKSAKRSVDVAVQEFRLPGIAKAMIEKRNQGVRVRLIIENTYNKGYSEYTKEEIARFTEREKGKYEDFLAFADLNKDGVISREEALERDTIPMIKEARLDYIDDTADGTKGSGLMHHKFTVIDEAIVLTGSANYTMSDIHGDAGNIETVGNANNFVVIKSPEVGKYFTEEFNIMWGDGPGGNTDSRFKGRKPHRPPKEFQVGDAKVIVKFSPDRRRIDYFSTSNGLIANTLNTAQKSIDLALFVFAEPYFGNLIEERYNQGVKVRALVERSFAYREYATTLDMWGLLSTQDCKLGNQRPWSKPITALVGSYNAKRGDMLHHKFGLIDKQTVITGSHNWSMNANYNNDETLLVIRHPMIAAHYEREYERLFSNATFGPTQKAIDRAPKTCNDLVTASRRKGPAKTAKKTRKERPDRRASQPNAPVSSLVEANPSSSDVDDDE